MISVLLAQILGIMFVVLGLSLVFHRKWTALAIDEMAKNPGVIWLAGLITVMLGSTIVGLNNIWTSGLPLCITILGWLTLIKGATILLFPHFSSSYFKRVNKGSIFVWGGMIITILGIILLLQ